MSINGKDEGCFLQSCNAGCVLVVAIIIILAVIAYYMGSM